MKKLAVYTLAVCSLFATSCATMLKGTSEEITVVSDPPGAEVSVNESRRGPTPVSFTVPSKEDLNISVSKAGYQPEDLQDPTSFRWGYETWAFLEFVIPMVVDLSDGAAWGHDHMTVTAHLEPNGQPTSAAATPPAASATSELPVSATISPAPVAAIAAAPVPVSADAPSASNATQHADGVTPSSPAVSMPQ